MHARGELAVVEPFKHYSILDTVFECSIEATTSVHDVEAVLIETLEPPLNRRRGDGLSAVEYLQKESPELAEKKLKDMLSRVKLA